MANNSNPFPKDPFWKPLSKALGEPDGFTVTFHLTGGQTLEEISIVTVEEDTICGESQGAGSGMNSPVAIRMGQVAAYQIEYC